MNESVPVKPAGGTYVKDPLAAMANEPPLLLAPEAATTVGATGPSMSVGLALVRALWASAMEATPARVAPATCNCVLPAVA